MPTYEQNKYCSKCKKNVAADKNDRCKICGEKIQRGKWSARFRVIEQYDEKYKRLSGFDTKREAQQAYINFMSTYKPLQNNKRSSYIFEDVYKEFFTACRTENEDSTLYDKNKIYNQYIIPFFKERDIKTITKSELINWQNELWTLKNPKTQSQYSWKYLSKIRGYFYNFLNYCERIYDIPNQFKVIPIPKNKTPKKVINFWELEEFNQFISTVDDILWNTLWHVFMFTGGRFNEIRALSDNDIKDGIIAINKSMTGKKVSAIEIRKATKNRKTVIKRIPDILMNKIELYKTWKKQNNVSNLYLFGGEMPLAETTIRRNLQEQYKNAKNTYKDLSYISPHGFRHSYVSLLIHLNVSTKVIAELIGDTEEQIIKTYGHLYKGAKEAAIGLLNERISDIYA